MQQRSRVELPFVVHNESGQRRRFELPDEPEAREGGDLLEDPSPIDPVLEYAEREGKLLARIAEQDREIESLRTRLERAELALGDMLEKIAVTAVHEAPTSPPPKPGDIPEDA